jgi:hypothetical protein
MKKLPVFFLLTMAMLVFGCQKSSSSGDLPEVNSHVLLGSSGATGTVTDKLVIDSTGEVVVPINKIGLWPKTDHAAAAVRFVDTGKRYAVSTGGHVTQLRVVFLVTLRNL